MWQTVLFLEEAKIKQFDHNKCKLLCFREPRQQVILNTLLGMVVAVHVVEILFFAGSEQLVYADGLR